MEKTYAVYVGVKFRIFHGSMDNTVQGTSSFDISREAGFLQNGEKKDRNNIDRKSRHIVSPICLPFSVRELAG